ncbi:MAG: enoyl-CoA hydratase/isomerase family protein [Rubrivivax sp.]|jgi:2-(1,2-epoxy-1,2-dihydrophenyl)acetyl-CoA isomerase
MSALTIDLTDGVARLTLNEPQARNALTEPLKAALADAIPRLMDDPAVRALVLTGAGGAFCAGGDLRSMASAGADVGVDTWRQRMREVHPWLQRLIGGDKPVVAAVDGPAYGAGFSLALAADFIVAAPTARFCMSFLRVGLVPDFAAMYTLPRVVGVQRARELMLSAREVTAPEALSLGLVLEVVPADRLQDRALALARSFVGASPLAVGLIRQTVRDALTTDLGRALTVEADHQALCFETEAHRSAVRRFLAKEPPAFAFPKPERA